VTKAERQELQAAAQTSAELLHRETHAPFVIVLLSDGSALSILGAWVPSAAVAAAIMRNAADSIDDASATIVDNRPKGSRGGAS
jgi:hypothetical protein